MRVVDVGGHDIDLFSDVGTEFDRRKDVNKGSDSANNDIMMYVMVDMIDVM